MPLVSVVLPVFNGERFLRLAMESILQQTFTDFEFIIIDDGSTDGTRSIIQSMMDARIYIMLNGKRLGIVESLNRGIKQARGKYLCRMDADDIALPRRIEKQVAYLESHNEVAMLGTDTIIIDQSGNEARREHYPQSSRDVKKTLFVHNPFAHGSVMVRASVISECGLYDDRFLHNEDYDLWLRIAARFDTENLSAPLLKRRIHNRNITVAEETELVKYRIRTLAHAALNYYHKPQYLAFVLRPIAAYLFRRAKGLFS